MKQKAAKPCISESQEQQALFQWAAWAEGKYPELETIYHIPNEGKRSLATGGKLKAEGLKAGFPDIGLSVAKRGYHGLYIEVKSQKGRMSPEQKEWQKRLTKYGNLSIVCYGFEEARDAIEWYLGQEKGHTLEDEQQC